VELKLYVSFKQL